MGERRVVAELRAASLSTRAIAAVVGVSDGTVRKDLSAGAQNYAPDSPSVTADDGPSPMGLDGRIYPASRVTVEPDRTETPATVAESITDELAALYAEGDENTEREPFTVAEAVAHRRRIREAEERAAKERQGTRTDRGRELPSKLEGSKGHERTTRHRTAKATGYGASTLDANPRNRLSRLLPGSTLGTC